MTVAVLTKYCRWFLPLVAAVIAFSCGKGESGDPGTAVWRASSTVSQSGGSLGIQLAGAVGTKWQLRITEGASWCSLTINDPADLAREGAITSSANQNIVDVYYTAHSGEEQRVATVEVTFAGKVPIALHLTQLSNNGGDSDDPFLHADTWAELPEKTTDGDYLYLTHYFPYKDGTARNYTFCFDEELHASLWVAYPLHSMHYVSGGYRTDTYGYDPEVERSWQANITRAYQGGYQRGHQLPSADRSASYEMNDQTFYATNMTPQIGSLNGDMWANLEAKVRNQRGSGADTLYVVTGCHYQNTNRTATDRDGMVCPVPTHYYKVLLRTTSGKRVAECSASELRAIGFWVEHRSYGDIQPPTSICMSVADIEAKTGFTFFPHIPAAAAASVKAQNSPSQWGITGN